MRHSQINFLVIRGHLIFRLVLILTVTFPVNIFAFSPPKFNASRYLEDYSYLKDPKKKTGYFDSIKYISLNTEGYTYFSIGGETRQHYERVENDNWGATKEDKSGYYLQRYMFHGDLHLNKKVRLFGQLQSGIETGRLAGPRGVDEDQLDLNQFFVDYFLKQSHYGSFLFRVGRQELIFGSRRFVNYRERPNIRLSFDGLKFEWTSGLWKTSGFVSKQVEIDRHMFDNDLAKGASFWGLYAVRKKPAFIPGNLDVYYLGLGKKSARFVQGTDNEQRHSLGLRWWGKNGALDYNFEYIRQFGDFGNGDINAFTYASDTGYTAKLYPHKVRISFRGDISSGDDDPNDSDLETFNLMFGKGKHLGQLAPYGPVNLFEVHPKAELTLFDKYKIVTMWEFLWRYSIDDGIYSIANMPLRTGSLSNSRYVGNQAILEVTWQVDRHLAVSGLISYFFTGTFLKETPPGEDIKYTSILLSYKF
jgi:hypothetical protein